MEFYANKWSFLSIVLNLTFDLISIIFLFLKEYSFSIVIFILANLLFLPVWLMRKYFFNKIKIDSSGLQSYIGKKTLLRLNWEEIKMIKLLPNKELIFSAYIFDDVHQIARNRDKVISFLINTENYTYLLNFKDKLPVEINGIENFKIN